MKFFPVLAAIVLSLAAVQAGRSRPQLVQLHPVTRQEYNELLRLTQGKDEVSEARLLSSSIAGIKGLASGFAVGNFIPAIFSTGSKDQSKKGRPLCVISTNDLEQGEQDRRLGRVVSIDYEPNSDSSSSSGSSSGHSSGHGSGSGSSDDDDVTTVNCILVVNGTDTSGTTTTTTTTTTTPKPGHGHGHGHGHGGYPYPPPPPYYPYGYPPYYYPYPPPPPPPKHHHTGGDKRSVGDENDFSGLIDAYNGYYYQPQGFHQRGGKRSRANQEVSAYQPASYPKQEYASNYPKVVRNYGLTHPAPVYVRSPQFEREQ